MHDSIYIQLLGFLGREEMARYEQTFKGSLELLISKLFPLLLTLLKITVPCDEWEAINISCKVDHGSRCFSVKIFCVSQMWCFSDCAMSRLPCVFHSGCFAWICNPKEVTEMRSLLFCFHFIFNSQDNACPMAGMVQHTLYSTPLFHRLLLTPSRWMWVFAADGCSISRLFALLRAPFLLVCSVLRSSPESFMPKLTLSLKVK